MRVSSPLTVLAGVSSLWVVSVAAAFWPAPDPVPPNIDTSAERIASLITQLGDRAFARREAATKELERIGKPALDALRKTAASDPDAEISQRADRVIQAITGNIRAVAAEKELVKLRGTWYAVSISWRDGNTGEDRTDTITYDGSRFIQRRAGQVWQAGTFRIVDATVTPKQIEYTATETGNKGVTWQSIYTLDGDDHRICSDNGDNNRPMEFSGSAGFLRVTRRQKE